MSSLRARPGRTTSEYLNATKKTDVHPRRDHRVRSEDKERKISARGFPAVDHSYSESCTPTRNDHTHEGGTHEEGFRAALTTLVNKYARERAPQGEGRENLTGDRHPRGPGRHLDQAAVNLSSRARPRPSSATPKRSLRAEGDGDQLTDWFDRKSESGSRHHASRPAAAARMAAVRGARADRRRTSRGAGCRQLKD